MSRPSGLPVLLVRPTQRNDSDVSALAERNIAADVDPYLVVGPSTDTAAHGRAQMMLRFLREDADWFAVTSANAVDALVALSSADDFHDALTSGTKRGVRIAAVGEATAKALHAYATITVHIPGITTAHDLAELLLRSGPRQAVAVPKGDQALPTLTDRLTQAHWQVHAAVVYTTQIVSVTPPSANLLAHGAYRVVVLRSPTAVRAVHQYSPELPATTTLVCGGPTTATEAKRLFAVPIVNTGASDSDTIADAVAAILAQ